MKMAFMTGASSRASIKESVRVINLISLICRKLAEGKSVPVIAEELEQDDTSFVSEICRRAEGFAPDYDTEKIYEEYVKRAEIVKA